MRLLAAIVLAVMLATSAGAQTIDVSPVALQVETAEATAIRKALAELEGRRAEVAALKETIGAKDKQIKALGELLDQQTQIIAQWKTAATERASANTLDAKLEASYKASVAKYSVELANVRIDRDKQASRKKWYFLAGLAVGILGSVYAAKD